ncbi:L-aspartate oxidase [soil metagenome]
MNARAASLIDSGQATRAIVAPYDAVVIGAGVAGLSFALRLPDSWRVALLAKGSLGESNTRYAQGGISAAIGPDDSPILHEEDTLAAGAGLCDPAAVRLLVDAAPEAVRWLLSIGTVFDRNRETGDIELGKEAAHSRRRVLHAGGDATGAEIERAMVTAVRRRDPVDIYEHAFAIDLVVEDGACTGLYCLLPRESEIVRFEAPAVVLAAGGAGQIWAVTSNPEGATADGLAMAIRAGVTVADLEFVQFHPTVLAVPGTESFLVTEAVRGEGAYLLDSDGRRFMNDLHPLAELAPRDVVARGIQSAMAAAGTAQVYLDLRHLDGNAMYARFPTISQELRKPGLDLANDLIPVAPAAHYFIGGVAADTNGSTSLPGLFSLGEASCSGVHGANRLASNSLLEGLVFGLEAAEHVAAAPPSGAKSSKPPSNRFADSSTKPATPDVQRVELLVERLREAMSRDVAVVRDNIGLSRAKTEIDAIAQELSALGGASRRLWEARNIALAAQAIIAAASFRQESRGAHYRSDFPSTNPALEGRHSLNTGPPIDAWAFGRLDEALAPPVASTSRWQTIQSD